MTNSTEQNPISEAKSHSVIQKIHHTFVTVKGHYHIYNSKPLAPLLSQMNPVHPTSLRSILISPSHLCLGLPSGLFPLYFLTIILYEFLISFMHATCLNHLVLLYWFTLTIFGEEYKLWSSTHNIIFSISLSLPPQHPVLKHSQSMFFPECEIPSFILI